MSKTTRDKKRFKQKEENTESFRYKLHFENYFKSHPCTYKKILKRQRRAMQKQALRENKNIPVFKNSDNSTYWNNW